MLRTVKKRVFVISATIVGGIIEWYEIFLFIHWADLFSQMFFNNEGHIAVYNTLFIFFVGFLGRPVGAILFGTIGDRLGRKPAFILSIGLMIIPSVWIGLLPSTEPGLYVAITLCFLRFIQGMAAGAELPGAMCYLLECAPMKERAFICSFTFLGPQIGILISQVESYFFETHFSPEFVQSWGWRISFIAGAVLACISLFFRRKLEESPHYQFIKEKHMNSRKPFITAIKKHYIEIIMGFSASLLAVVGFYMFAIFLEIYFNKVLGISKSQNLLISISMMLISTISLPFIGKLGDKYKIKNLLSLSAFGILVSAIPFYFSAEFSSILFTTLFELFILFFLNIQFSLLPTFVSELFPTSVRYTGIALGYGICDSVVGGATPWVAGIFNNKFGSVATFLIFICCGAIVSLLTFFFIKEKGLKVRNT